MEKKEAVTLLLISNSLNLAARGLFFGIYQLMEQDKKGYLEYEEKELAERLNINFPHFCKSLKVLVEKRIIIKTQSGISCPMMEKELIRGEIRRAFSPLK